MKAVLEFNLPDDRVEHLWAVHAGDMASAICDADDQLRAWRKYGHKFEHPNEAVEAARTLLSEVINIARGEA